MFSKLLRKVFQSLEKFEVASRRVSGWRCSKLAR